MNDDEKINQMYEAAIEIQEYTDREKEAAAGRAAAKTKLLELIKDDFARHKSALPTRSVDVPMSFFDKTGMKAEEFAQSRYPGWQVVDYSADPNDDQVMVFELIRDPAYMNYSFEVNDEFKISKEVVEYTPVVDWDTLRRELPELFGKLAKPVESYEINEDALDQLIQIEPEVLSKLQRHMLVKQPMQKVTTRKLKGKDGDRKRASS